MEVTEKAKRMVKFYVGSDAPLIRAFGEELYLQHGDREEAEEIAQKILDLQEAARRAEDLESKLNEMRNAEHALSDSYIRLRHIVGAMNPPSVESKEIWAHTEQKAQKLLDRCEALETEWRAQEERAENAETELVDLRERYKQLEAVAKDFLRRNANGPLFYRDLYNRFKEIVK